MQKRVPLWKRTEQFRSARTIGKGFWKQVLIVTSSLVVLASFTLKEPFSEHLKDKIGKIDIALTELEKKPSDYDDSSVRQMISKLNKLNASESDQKMIDENNESVDKSTEIMNMFAATTAVIKEFPDTSTYQKDLGDLRNKLDNALNEQVRIHFSKDKPKIKVDGLSLWSVESQTNILRKQIRVDFGKRKAGMEYEAKRIAWIVYALFFVAWALGLVASLSGEKPKTEGE